MEEDKLQTIVLKKGDYLVEHLPNFFRKKDSNKFSSKLREVENCFVGKIQKAQPGHQDRVGMLVYYLKDVCPVIELPEIGEYHVVNEAYVILFQSNINNY
jgi:hypothetical protein